MTHPLLNSPLRKAAGWLCQAWGWWGCRAFVGTARSTGWLCDLVGAALPFKAVCKAWAKAEVSDVTVKRDVPDEDVGSLVGGLQKIKISLKFNFYLGFVPQDVLKAVLKAKLKFSSEIFKKRVVIYKWESICFYFYLLFPNQCCRSIEKISFCIASILISLIMPSHDTAGLRKSENEGNLVLQKIWIFVHFENKRRFIINISPLKFWHLYF